LASEKGNEETVQFLIEKGIEINQTNTDGFNALDYASREGHTGVVNILIEKGIKN
jgi:ankyrin repeat protein